MSHILNLQKLTVSTLDANIQAGSTVSACCHSLNEGESGGGDSK